mgnify:CR=1 FL=1
MTESGPGGQGSTRRQVCHPIGHALPRDRSRSPSRVVCALHWPPCVRRFCLSKLTLKIHSRAVMVNRILVAAVLTLSSCWRSHAFVPACPLNAGIMAEHRTGRRMCAWRMHSADVARRNVLKGMGAFAAASAISGTSVPARAKEAPYDTQKLADEWEGFLPGNVPLISPARSF